ncbi:alpha/beta hydrolase [Streptomyces sp. NBC_01537]|uniref:alpha/beta fold hydrolase n=1 Tax=Streptomyces sp. NBC_01537 TaxID=2903896 RepID=UPI00386E36EB
MPTFTSYDGTELAYHLRGEGSPLIVLPGGPMRASAYLGDLGGLSAHRQLVLLDLRGTGDSGIPEDPATYRCDRLVPDVEALRAHLGLDRVDVLGHSAAGDLATLYAAAYPERVGALILVTPRARAAGIDFTEQHRRETAALRADEPWFPEVYAALERIWAGKGTEADWDAVVPFYYGRWDAVARAHAAEDAAQSNEEAQALYPDPAAFDPPTTRAALAALDAPVLIIAGELDSGPTPAVAAEFAAVFPKGEVVVQPGAGHFPWLDDANWFVRAITGR